MPSSSNSSTHANLFGGGGSSLCWQLVKISSFSVSGSSFFSALAPFRHFLPQTKQIVFWNPMKLFHEQIESVVVFDDGKTSEQRRRESSTIERTSCRAGFEKKKRRLRAITKKINSLQQRTTTLNTKQNNSCFCVIFSPFPCPQ